VDRKIHAGDEAIFLKEMSMEPDNWSLYRQMLRSRLFEEKVKELWEAGQISGEMHLGLGEEAIVAGVVAHLQEGDAMALDHRGVPPLVMRGVNLVSLLRELLGDEGGLCGGWGGHMHLFSRALLSASTGIVGATGPMAVGFALSAEHLRPHKIAVSFFGEGAANQGMVMESMNLAVAWNLPVLFICKNNEMSITTFSPSVTGGGLLERAKSFGMNAYEVDGRDAETVWAVAGEAIQGMRDHNGPVFILAKCVHFEGHMLGDPLLRVVRNPLQRGKEISGGLFRATLSRRGPSKEDRLKRLGDIMALLKRVSAGQKKKGNDPLNLTRQKLLKDRARLDQIEKDVAKEIRVAVNSALLADDGEGGN
jgi:TPP-dependent pyruvate/acetoin dehydrogenase alpha subunit